MGNFHRFSDFSPITYQTKYSNYDKILIEKLIINHMPLKILELQKFCKQSDFRESSEKIFFFRKVNLELPIVSLYLPKNTAEIPES